MRDDIRLEALTILSDPKRFRDARAWVTRIALRAGFDLEEAQRFALALSEACANSYRHAYGGKPEGRIDLQVAIEPTTLRLTVRDYGESFDATRYSPPSFSELAERGYGIHLMRELMDEVNHTALDAGTRVDMVKRRSGNGGSHGGPGAWKKTS